jgi:TetR/AcrR family transcriptional regulator, tetracycline repressor protein
MARATKDETGDARPMRPTLNREFIVATAVRLVDSEGLARLSMRRLGAALGVDPMAIYHYFPSKAALFDGLVEAIFLEFSVRQEVEGLPWKEAMTEYLQSARVTLRNHPAVLPAMATRPVNTQGVLEMIEQPVACMVKAGANPAAALDAMNALFAFTIGHVLAEVGEPVGGPDDPGFDLESLDLTALPTLVTAFQDGYAYDAQRQYDLGLDAMLTGLGARLNLRDSE